MFYFKVKTPFLTAECLRYLNAWMIRIEYHSNDMVNTKRNVEEGKS